MMDDHDSITKVQRMYFSFIKQTGSEGGGGGGLSAGGGRAGPVSPREKQMERDFSRPQVLTRLGRLIFELKVSHHFDCHWPAIS